jgi:carboxymethylenebutenolidase
MKLVILLISLVMTNSAAAQQDPGQEIDANDCASVANFTIMPEKVAFPGPQGRTLYGWLYKPKGKGPFPAVVWNHGSELMTDRPLPFYRKDLAAFYVGKGFVFFAPHRTGHGMSKDAGESGATASNRNCVGSDIEQVQLCKVRYHEESNLDTVAAVKWLQWQRFVKRRQLVVSGASYGGIQTILTAEKRLSGVAAFVPFTPAAQSWPNVRLRERLMSALKKSRKPVFLIQAEGDYSLGPYEVLGAYLNTKGGLNRAKLYPKFGSTPQEAHGLFSIRCKGIEIWGSDVAAFLKAALK